MEINFYLEIYFYLEIVSSIVNIESRKKNELDIRQTFLNKNESKIRRSFYVAK